MPCVFLPVRETRTQLPLSALRKVWGEAVSYVCGLKEDYLRLYQGQRAAMCVQCNSFRQSTGTPTNVNVLNPVCLCRLSLLRYNTNLTRFKNVLLSESQQLRAKLAIFKTSIQHDLEQYTQQMNTGICECILFSCCEACIHFNLMHPIVTFCCRVFT